MGFISQWTLKFPCWVTIATLSLVMAMLLNLQKCYYLLPKKCVTLKWKLEDLVPAGM